MKKIIVSRMMLTLLVVGMLTLAFNSQPVKADWTWTETIYIRADGSVEPDTAPISTVDNITYTFTDNIVGDIPLGTSAIVVERDNIVIDGTDHALQGIGAASSKGIDLSQRRNVTIKNTKVRSFNFGIWLSRAHNNSIAANNVTNNYQGILVLSESSSNTISGNNITNNGDGMLVEVEANHNIISGNDIKNNSRKGIILEKLSNDNIISGNHEVIFGISMI